MKLRFLLAAGTALVASAAGLQMTAYAQDSTPPAAQAERPGPHPYGPHSHGPMGRGGPGGPGGWHHNARFGGPLTPERCEEHAARAAGMRAYLETRLHLTAQQKPLWDQLQTAEKTSADQERTACLQVASAAKPATPPNAVERRQTMRTMLASHLQSLDSTKAPFEALYQSLTPEQRTLLDRPMHGLGGRHGRGPDDRGPNQPPAPPAKP